MKKIIICLVFIVTLYLSACGKHQHTYTTADCTNAAICSVCKEIGTEALGHTTQIGSCSRCKTIQNEKLIEKFNADISKIMDIGYKIIEITSRIENLNSNDKYSYLVEADKETEAMSKIYNEIIDDCSNIAELKSFVYQFKLLKNTSPNKIENNDDVLIANQTLLYKLYLQQISSTFTILPKYMDYFSGKGEKPMGNKYYSEVPDMPTPDSIISGIKFDSMKNASGNIQYMYLIGDNQADAEMNYNIYLKALNVDTELDVKIDNSTAYVSKNGTMVSAMMSGTDTEKGHFLIVSFRN